MNRDCIRPATLVAQFFKSTGSRNSQSLSQFPYLCRWTIFSVACSAVTVFGIGAVFAEDPAQSDVDPVALAKDAAVIKQLQAIYLKDAAEYAIYRDADHREKLDLREDPVYIWTNVRQRQMGSVFVWTWHGCPEAIGSIFSYPAQIPGKRGISHEFHTLSTAVLVPVREAENQWNPQETLSRKPIPGATKPVDNPRQRLFQMRELSRAFSARTVDPQEQTWELRLLPQPLFRYQSTDPKIIDGTLFAYVSSAGTDPEILLVIEAAKTAGGAIYQYATCRFSNHDLYVKYQDQPVWSSIRGVEPILQFDPKQSYRLFRDRRIDEIGSPTDPE